MPPLSESLPLTATPPVVSADQVGGCLLLCRWDDVEKFSAINCRFVSLRHGIRFELTLHTKASWEGSITHAQYMRFMFNNVIKTDILFEGDQEKIAAAKMEMRR